MNLLPNILFADTSTKLEFYSFASEEIQHVVLGYAWWCLENGIHSSVVINSLSRTKRENDLVGGVPNSLHLYRQHPDGTQQIHAVDFKNRHYTPEEKVKLEQLLHNALQRPDWEVITRVHGSGPHFHVGDRRAIPLPLVE